MDATSKPLSEAVLRRLTNDALTTFFGEAERYEAAARPGLQLAISFELFSIPINSFPRCLFRVACCVFVCGAAPCFLLPDSWPLITNSGNTANTRITGRSRAAP